MMGKNVAILMLARTPVEKIQLVVVLVTHRIAVKHQHLWGALGAIVVPLEVAVEINVLGLERERTGLERERTTS
eukprot:scaffold4854_cov114-Skeletonema_marinoi.AAC.9